MADKATRRKVVTSRIAEDGSAVSYDIHGPLDPATGKYPVVDTINYPATAVPENRQVWFMLHGISQVLASRYNRLDDNATPGDVKLALLEVLDAISDGSWSPGRSFAEREPTDLECAIAEATGQSVSDIIDQIENTFEKNEDGTIKITRTKDGKERRHRVFNQRMLDALAEDAKIKPILARLTAERAKRLQAEAKKGGTDLLDTMFTAANVSPPPAGMTEGDIAAQ